jgi:hypothetical protein
VSDRKEEETLIILIKLLIGILHTMGMSRNKSDPRKKRQPCGYESTNDTDEYCAKL